MSLTTPAENRAILAALDGKPATITTQLGVVRELVMLFDEHRDPQLVNARTPRNPYSIGQTSVNVTEVVGVVEETDVQDLDLQDAQVDVLGESFRISYFDHDDGIWRLEMRRF